MDIRVRLYLWPHRLLFLGPGFDARLHRHHAAQLCWTLHGQLKVRDALTAPWQQAAGFFVAPDQPHAFDAGAASTVILYLEPEGAEYAAYLASAGLGPDMLVPLDDHAATTAAARLLSEGGDCDDAEDVCHRLLGLALMPPQTGSPDARITAALDWIRSHLPTPIRLADVANAVHLSESHLAHLFAERIGVPLRRYVLWQRLRTAVETAMCGASLTDAAHAAGFADSAHLSRTFRDTFGVTPSFLFEHRARLDVRFCGVPVPAFDP